MPVLPLCTEWEHFTHKYNNDVRKTHYIHMPYQLVATYCIRGIFYTADVLALILATTAHLIVARSALNTLINSVFSLYMVQCCFNFSIHFSKANWFLVY